MPRSVSVQPASTAVKKLHLLRVNGRQNRAGSMTAEQATFAPADKELCPPVHPAASHMSHKRAALRCLAAQTWSCCTTAASATMWSAEGGSASKLLPPHI